MCNNTLFIILVNEVWVHFQLRNNTFVDFRSYFVSNMDSSFTDQDMTSLDVMKCDSCNFVAEEGKYRYIKSNIFQFLFLLYLAE